MLDYNAISQMTDCEDRARLLETFRAAMSRLAELRAEQLEAWRRQEPVKQASAERIRRALEIAEQARMAFEQHTEAHRCDREFTAAAARE